MESFVYQRLFLDKVNDVRPNLLFILFIQNLMTHAGIKFALHVTITAVAHKINCLLKIFLTDNAGVVRAGDEENWQIGTVNFPAGFTIGGFHKAK